MSRLLSFQLEQAGDFGQIAQRDTPGIFGLGVPDPTLTAITDSQGNVYLTAVDSVEPFTLEPDGTYQGVPGDFATLTLTDGVYQLRETTGTLEVFNANGYVEFCRGYRRQQNALCIYRQPTDEHHRYRPPAT